MLVQGGKSPESVLRTTTIERTVRYVLSPRIADDIPRQIDDLWLLFHGYAQTAPEFFDAAGPLLDASGFDAIAPEGPSRFYARSGRGDVVASWMTSVEREAEIAEYLRFFENLLTDIDIPPTSRLHLLGFSQGVATALRFLAESTRTIASCILWSAGFRRDELENAADAIAETGRFYLVDGEADPLVEVDVIDRLADDLRSLGAAVERRSHPGRHELDADLLRGLGSEIVSGR